MIEIVNKAVEDQFGYLRDDNSLIKEGVKSLVIQSPREHYNGRRIGRGGARKIRGAFYSYMAIRASRSTIETRSPHALCSLHGKMLRAR